MGSQSNWFEAERETMRATAYLRYDLRDLWPVAGRWLGRHTFTGLYEKYAVD